MSPRKKKSAERNKGEKKDSLTQLFKPFLLNGAFEILSFDQIRNIILILVFFAFFLAFASFLLLQTLVTLGQFAERSQAVGTELVQDSGDKFGEFLFFAVSVDGEGVGGNGGMDC